MDIWEGAHWVVIGQMRKIVGPLLGDVHYTKEPDGPRYLELDHNTPRSDGGLNHISNRILLCGPCNRLKSNTFTLSGLGRENKKRGFMR